MIVILAAMLAAQAPAAAEAGQLGQPVQVTGIKNKKPKRTCQLVDVSGSRMRQRVCTDENGISDRLPGVTDAAANPGMLHAQPGAAAEGGGLGAPPQ